MTTPDDTSRYDAAAPSAPGLPDDAAEGALLLLGVMLGGRYPELVPAARARGLAVFGVDADTPRARRFDAARRERPDHPLAGLTDLAWIAGEQHEAVVQQALDWNSRVPLRGVIAYGEDYVEAAALVADLLGLPSPGLRAARVCRNKLLQRRYLAEWSPRSTLVEPARRAAVAAAWADFPAVLKPLDGSASDGVERIDDAAGLAAALEGRDADVPLLLEELAEGHELSVETLVHEGRAVFASPTGKRTNERDPDAAGEPAHRARYFVELGHTVPDPELDDAARAEVLRVNEAVLRRLDFRDGIAHAEYRVRADGRVRLMEIAARAAGDQILTLYTLATGSPLEESLLAICLGEHVRHPQPHRYARQVYPTHRPGILRDVIVSGMDVEVGWLTERWMWPPVKPLAATAPGTVQMVVAGRARGDELREIRASSDRSAMYIVDAPTVAELDELEARVDAALAIVVEPAEAEDAEAEGAGAHGG